MALSARQITLVGSAAAVPTLVKGSGTGTTFKNIVGNLQDPLPLEIKNEDATAVVWVGGSDCDATHGQSIAPMTSKVMNLYGESEIPYIFSTGTPVVSILAGRQ